METSPIGAGSLLGTAVKQSTSQLAGVARTQPKPFSPADSQPPAKLNKGSRGRALGILSQEIRQILAASYSLRFASALPAYSVSSDPLSATGVADDALTAGRALAERSPLSANASLGELREEIEDAADDVRQLVGDDDDGLDDAMQRISAGIGELEDDAARNVESSASVLSYDSELRQRSTIRIRTQEGDIVRLDLRRLEQMSASDVAVSDGNSLFSATEIQLSSRTRTVLSVNGDLSEAEFAAIQSVFAQAEVIAAEFFGGDLASAFNMASGIEFDTDQLARVRMRFREQVETSFTFASIRSVAPELPPVAEPASAVAGIIDFVPESVPETSPVPEAVATQIADVPEAVAVPAASEVAEPANEAAVQEGAIDGFFRLLADFLRSMNAGFEYGEGSYRYFYAESFRLEILKAVLEVSAPEESGEAALTAATMIDSLSDAEADS